jgi:hypothetical protein
VIFPEMVRPGVRLSMTHHAPAPVFRVLEVNDCDQVYYQNEITGAKRWTRVDHIVRYGVWEGRDETVESREEADVPPDRDPGRDAAGLGDALNEYFDRVRAEQAEALEDAVERAIRSGCGVEVWTWLDKLSMKLEARIDPRLPMEIRYHEFGIRPPDE